MSGLFPLTVAGAEVRRRGARLLGPVDLTLAAGGVTVVIGPNGSGKTTLLRALHGLERLWAGEVRWALPTDEARARQAFVLQSPVMLRRSVLGNLLYPLRLRRSPGAEATARDWATRIGLGHALDRPAHSLSGGEKQKLALARALVTGPEALFLDEPCASIDGASTRAIEAVLLDAARAGTHVVIATHDLAQARRLGPRGLFLLGGRVHEAGDVVTTPRTAEARAFLNGDLM